MIDRLRKVDLLSFVAFAVADEDPHPAGVAEVEAFPAEIGVVAQGEGQVVFLAGEEGIEQEYAGAFGAARQGRPELIVAPSHHPDTGQVVGGYLGDAELAGLRIDAAVRAAVQPGRRREVGARRALHGGVR